MEPEGKSGRLALMWRETVSIKILQADKRIIDTQIRWKDKVFYLTCVYGHPVRKERGEVWERITRIGLNREGSWMLTGDFNELADPKEKLGGPNRSVSSCQEFKHMLRVCGLWETRHTWYQYSWFGNRNNELVQCRLDRTVVNQEWSELFPQAQAHYLQKICSDHNPLITCLDGGRWNQWATFRYDQRWVKKQGFKEMVEQKWRTYGPQTTSNMMSKIAACRKDISYWKRQTKPNSAKRIQELHFRIDQATRQTPVCQRALSQLRHELNQEYLNEEIFWQQKSRQSWLQNGDRNTKYFHAATKNRRAQNRIKNLLDDAEKEWHADSDLGRVAEAYFKLLFTSEDVGIQIDKERIMANGQQFLSQVQNDNLTRPVSGEEVRKAVFDINPHKCPGPDGMSAHFYQQFWTVVGQDIVHMVQRFMETGATEEGINCTNICLIPKKQNASRLTDYRPISLCNVLYKIIAKVMANRLKKVMPTLISETQAAFVEGRLISDNILVAHELLHALNSKNKCSKEFVAIKTDISKAYDRVE